MNLIVPINLQALRVTPNDASLVTPNADLFAGSTTAFERLPWRDADYIEHWNRPFKANVIDAVSTPLWEGPADPIEAGVHLHWALPDGVTRGVQQADGSIAFPAVPNRWLVTRIVSVAGASPVTKQWVVESDRLLTEDAYLADYHANGRKAVAVPVGWTVVPGTQPEQGGAVYLPPWRRIGQVFELAHWQPEATPAGAAPDAVLHLDELPSQPHAFAAPGPPATLRAVGNSGPAFAAYYPDSRRAFGFHDGFADLPAVDLANSTFTVSYIVTGWHAHAGDDPLQTAAFVVAQQRATADNAAAPTSKQVTPAQLTAGVVQSLYGWGYDPAVATPSRCLYGGQVAGLAWDTTGHAPDGDPKFPKCYLPPLPDDASVRVAIGGSASSSFAALVSHEWSSWNPGDTTSSQMIPPAIAADVHSLEYIVDALQLGLLRDMGAGVSLVEIEQKLHQTGFAALRGGRSWSVRARGTAPDKTTPHRFDPPEAVVPDPDGAMGKALATLQLAQSRLDAVLGLIDSCRRQIFLDWNAYFTQWGAPGGEGPEVEPLKASISAQIVDLWAKLDAAFGTQTAPSPETGNLPVFFASGTDWLTSGKSGYSTSAAPASLAGQVVAAANAIITMLAAPAYKGFELDVIESARFWQPNEPVLVATGDSLKPAQRNGIAKQLPCRLSSQLVARIETKIGSATASLTGADAAAALAIATPQLRGTAVPEATDTSPLMADVAAMLGEACLLDATLAAALAPRLGSGASAADLAGAMVAIVQQIDTAWKAGAPEGKAAPAILSNPTAEAGAVTLSLAGQAPQGLAITTQPGVAWQDPFLPLFLVWEVDVAAHEKATVPGAARYDAGFITDHFTLDAETIDLTLSGTPPPTQGGSAPIRGFIPLSSRSAEPLIDQIRQYLQTASGDQAALQQVVDHLKGKPLLSQGLSGLNPALQSRALGTQLAVFNPFYYSEPVAGALSSATDNFNYANVLTHYVGAVAGALGDQVPLGLAGFNPLRSGYLSVGRISVVDVFGRRRTVIDRAVASDATKVIASARMEPPAGAPAGSQCGLAPRLSMPARLLFQWVSGNDASVVSNSAASTSPIAGWVVHNYLDNSLALFAPSGAPLGSLGVFGGQTEVHWQSAPGHPAQPMATDLGRPDLAHLRKFATFLLGKPSAVFDAFVGAIDGAHTYILPTGNDATTPYAVMMGRPLALVRAELRLELPGLPPTNTALAAVTQAIAANGDGPYDWTLRDDAGLRRVGFPVRLGDRDRLSDGLVGYFVDQDADYDAFYAPAAAGATGPVRQPSATTLTLDLHAALDPPSAPFANAAAQSAALRDASVRPAATAVTMLIDPRADVHATTGILPIEPLALAPEFYARALEEIEVSFFTHPILRGAQSLDLPAPTEPGFTWAWVTAVKSGGIASPKVEPLVPSSAGDRAHFNFSPQNAEEGWMTLVPQQQPAQQE